MWPAARPPSTRAESSPSTRVPTPAVLSIAMVPARFPDDRSADGQTETVALGLGREERFEDASQVFGGNPLAGIGDDDVDTGGGRAAP